MSEIKSLLQLLLSQCFQLNTRHIGKLLKKLKSKSEVLFFFINFFNAK